MPKYVLPEGSDVQVKVKDLSHSQWIVDPETLEWAIIKQIEKNPFRCGLGKRTGEVVCLLSLRRLGERTLPSDSMVTLRLPSDA